MLAAWHMIGFFQAGRVSARETDARSPPASGAEYILGPQDKVRVKVFAWRPSRDEVYEWKALNDVYTVGASGEISLPLIGEVPAGGSSPRDVSFAISEQLKSSLGLVEAPRASVEIVEFRPFYILGAVQRPGEYPYRPALTIIQALSIAGGLVRFNEFEAVKLDRDTIATNGERGVIAAEINSLLAKRSRIEAEINGTAAVKFPASLVQQSASEGFGALLDEEQRIFSARLAAFESRSKDLDRTRKMLQNELAAVESHLSGLKSHILVAAKELKQFDDLLARKLTTTTRRAEAARNLRQVESDRIRLQTSLASTRQELNRVDMEAHSLREGRVSQAVVELRAAQARLDELNQRIKTAETLVYEASVVAPHLASFENGLRKISPNYTIVRVSGGAPVEISAQETTVLQPGDTIKVETPVRALPAVRPSETSNDPRAVAPETLRLGMAQQ